MCQLTNILETTARADISSSLWKRSVNCVESPNISFLGISIDAKQRSREVSVHVEVIYDLKASTEVVGYLYLTIVDKHDRIIDGQHHLKIDPKWPCFRLSHIETIADYLMARIIANTHRRIPDEQEKTEWLTELAEETGWNTEQISEKIGMSPSWVQKYLPERLKEPTKVRAGRLGADAKAKSATRRVASQLSEVRRQPGFHLKKDADDTDRFLDGLEKLSSRLKPGDKLTTALMSWCRTRKVHWSAVVTEGLKLFFAAQGEKL